MKNLKFSLFILFLTGVFLLSCKKDINVTTLYKNIPSLYESTFKVYDADSTHSVSLRFRSLSKELLTRLHLERFEFRLIKTPSVSDNRSNPNVPVSSDKADLVQKNPDQIINSLDALRLSGNVVVADIVTESNMPSLSIQLKRKKGGNLSSDGPSVESLWLEGTADYLIGGDGWHRVQIDNLSSTPLDVSFYYDSCNDDYCTWTSDGRGTINQYSGYSYTLYQGGWAWYYNCDKSVGAYMVIPPENDYWFSWTLWSDCMPSN
jgi:hypothetical protein